MKIKDVEMATTEEIEQWIQEEELFQAVQESYILNKAAEKWLSLSTYLKEELFESDLIVFLKEWLENDGEFNFDTYGRLCELVGK